CVLALVPDILIPLRGVRISWVPHCSLQTRRRLRLRCVLLTGKKNRQCAHSETIACWFDDTIGTTQSVNFGVITFTYWFRLECFAVYASSPLLPPEMQDSLRSDLANLLRRGFHPQETVQLFPAHRQLHR
ncbi:hypothetical protein, partial [Xenorhabdus thuongxuanensis]|uniref:hypothetical protein n=1 Tax=Xenorhabdus thuongxuanensis TaxID=1873484 RepID=UPI001ABF15AB